MTISSCSPMYLTSTKIVITGGSSGMGAELARQLTAVGARVVICGKNVSGLYKMMCVSVYVFCALPLVIEVFGLDLSPSVGSGLLNGFIHAFESCCQYTVPSTMRCAASISYRNN